MKMIYFHLIPDALLVDLKSVIFVGYWNKTDMERLRDVKINAVDAADWDILKEPMWK